MDDSTEGMKRGSNTQKDCKEAEPGERCAELPQGGRRTGLRKACLQGRPSTRDGLSPWLPLALHSPVALPGVRTAGRGCRACLPARPRVEHVLDGQGQGRTAVRAVLKMVSGPGRPRTSAACPAEGTKFRHSSPALRALGGGLQPIAWPPRWWRGRGGQHTARPAWVKDRKRVQRICTPPPARSHLSRSSFPFPARGK